MQLGANGASQEQGNSLCALPALVREVGLRGAALEVTIEVG